MKCSRKKCPIQYNANTISDDDCNVMECPYRTEYAEIIERPFNWNDNISEIAQEDFSMIRQSLSYGTATSIGMALAKLELLERQGCKVEESEEQA